MCVFIRVERIELFAENGSQELLSLSLDVVSKFPNFYGHSLLARRSVVLSSICYKKLEGFSAIFLREAPNTLTES